jgi:hypothetical protein
MEAIGNTDAENVRSDANTIYPFPRSGARGSPASALAKRQKN